MLSLAHIALIFIFPLDGDGVIVLPNAKLSSALVQIWPYKIAEVSWPTPGVLTDITLDRLIPSGGINYT